MVMGPSDPMPNTSQSPDHFGDWLAWLGQAAPARRVVQGWNAFRQLPGVAQYGRGGFVVAILMAGAALGHALSTHPKWPEPIVVLLVVPAALGFVTGIAAVNEWERQRQENARLQQELSGAHQRHAAEMERERERHQETVRTFNASFTALLNRHGSTVSVNESGIQTPVGTGKPKFQFRAGVARVSAVAGGSAAEAIGMKPNPKAAELWPPEELDSR